MARTAEIGPSKPRTAPDTHQSRTTCVLTLMGAACSATAALCSCACALCRKPVLYAALVMLVVSLAGTELGIHLYGKQDLHAADVSCVPFNVDRRMGNAAYRFDGSAASGLHWHWHMAGEGPMKGATLQQRCPSQHHDFELLVSTDTQMARTYTDAVGPALAAAVLALNRRRTVLPPATFQTRVLDCHGDVAFRWLSTRSDRGIVVDVGPAGTSVAVRFLIFAPALNTSAPAAYVKASDAADTGMVVRSAMAVDAGTPAMTLTWSTASRAWVFVNEDPFEPHPMANLLLASALASNVAFARRTMSTDGCNAFFFSVGYILLTLLALSCFIYTVRGLVVVACRSRRAAALAERPYRLQEM